MENNLYYALIVLSNLRTFLRGRVTESVLEDLRILILEELETLTLDVEQELESEQEGEPVLVGTVKAWKM